MTRRRPHSDANLSLNTQINAISPKTEETIINTLLTLRGDAITQATLKQIGYKLGELARNTNLFDPEEVKGKHGFLE